MLYKRGMVHGQGEHARLWANSNANTLHCSPITAIQSSH